MATLATKYRPKKFDDVVEQSTVVEILRNMCKDENLTCRNFLLIGSAGCGKSQPLDENVLTKDGWKQMKDIEVGDMVYTINGNTAKVSAIFPQGLQCVYTITLENGDEVRVSEDHINVVAKKAKGSNHLVECEMKVPEMLKYMHYDGDLYVPLATPPQGKETPNFVHYAFALMHIFGIYDKNIDVLSFRKSFEGYKFIMDDVMDHYNLKLRHLSPLDFSSMVVNYASSVNCWAEFKNDYSIIFDNAEDDYISLSPEIFSTWTIATRAELLKCYVDIFRSNRKQKLENHETYKLMFSTEKFGSLKARDDFIEFIYMLAASLGCKFYAKSESPETREDHMIGEITLSDYVIFDELKESKKYYNKITSILYDDEEECQCIYVNDLSHTYITSNYIPTHNTTLARIMGNEINDNIGEIIEIDAASNGSTDSVRLLVQQAQSYPVGQKWKIFILDECHAFSNAAWQILLKVLEDQPARTVWFLCTTNPEKIPATILSRVQTFQLSKISLQGIEKRIKYVIEKENEEGRNITYTDDAINLLAKLASGGMRDALTLLDKALAYSKDLTSENLEKALNLPSYDDYFELLSAYAKKDNIRIIKVIDSAYNSGVNFVKWLENFHSFVMNIVKFIFLKDISATMIPIQYYEKIQKYNEKQALVCLALANKLVNLNQEVKFTSFQQELALTYLCFPTASK